MSAALLILLLAAGEPGPVAGAEAGEQVPSETRLDILAPARSGEMQCYQPDYARRTCRGMAAYSFEADGRIINRAQMIIDEDNAGVMHVTSTVVVRNRAVCGKLDNLSNATFTVAGQPATEGQANGYRLLLAVAPKRGEVCTRWVADGHGLIASGTLDGKERKDFEQRMIWVLPEEGFKVAP